MQGSIGTPDWEACETCGNCDEGGCNISHIEMSVYLGDWIICDDYENKQEEVSNENQTFDRGKRVDNTNF